VSYSHGLGDVIMLTPCLRELHQRGYTIDLMCRKSVKESHLLDNCKYINKLIEIQSPWSGDFDEIIVDNNRKFDKISNEYDWIGESLHLSHIPGEHKIDMTIRELGLETDDKTPEVYIGEDVREFTDFPDGYIVVNSVVEFHREHDWDARAWIKENLPELPILELGRGGDFYRKWPDINKTFALLKGASYLVLNSSVWVHAADAMGLTIEAVNYGNQDRKMDPVNSEVRHIRREGKWER